MQSATEYLRISRSQFSQRPTAAYRGARPGHDPQNRGGLWTPRTREAIEAGDGNLLAGLLPSGSSHTLSVEAEPGGSLPWEGSSGGVNTGNGNKLTSLNLVSWKARGGASVDFTLFHNSQTTYNDELGHGWSWTYDIYVNNLTGDPVLHWGDGTAIPYTAPGGSGSGDITYVRPAGAYDNLVKHTDGTWTLTTKSQTLYQFNSAGFCNAVVDRNGNQTTITLNSSNYATKVTDATGRHYDIALDGSNNFTSLTDPTGRVWTFTRDSGDQLITVTWPTLDGLTYTDGYAYNASHDITTHTDRRGKAWTYAYNTDGSLASETNPLGKTWSYGYAAGVTTVTNPLGKDTTHNYSGGKLVSVVDENGYSDSFTARDSNNNITTRVDARGKTWTATYDSQGNVLTQTNPLGKVWTYTYNSTNDLLTVTDPLSHTTTYTYDSNGNPLTAVDALGHTVTTTTYSTTGLPLTVTNGESETTTISYDSNGYPTTVTEATSRSVTSNYDSLGRTTWVKDPLLNQTSFTYDDWGRLVMTTLPGGATTQTAYNVLGQKTSETNERGKVTAYTYDDAGRLLTTTNARGDVEIKGYDDANRNTTITNGRGKTRTYVYTDRGDVYTLTLPDGAVETWTHDGAGNITAYTNGASQTVLYAFDNAGRQTGIDYPTGTADVTFAYDDANRRSSMVDGIGTTSWTYDAADRNTAFNSPQGNLTYGYDLANRRTSMVDGSGTTTYVYDDAGRKTSLTNALSETTTWSYDTAGRLSRQTYSTGQYDDYGYDSRSRTTSIVHKKSSGTTIDSETYTYDAASNMATRNIGGATTTYTYDDIDQLLSESRTGYSATYTYDANGNRLTKTLGGVTDAYTYDDGDKMLTAGAKSYTYDGDGRTTTVTIGSSTTTLTYDAEGRVTGISYPGGATNSFTYNGLDTRVSKTDSAGTFTYKRDGAHVTAPVLGDGAATYTPGISQRRSGATYFEVPNFLGSITRQTNTAQNSTATRTYDAFGLLLSTAATPRGSFGFAGAFGYQEDGDSGLKLLGHRYYDPSTGRFLTRDQAKDGRNWYGYCNNNPTVGVDPTGKAVFIVALFFVGFLAGAGTALFVGIRPRPRPLPTTGPSPRPVPLPKPSPDPSPIPRPRPSPPLPDPIHPKPLYRAVEKPESDSLERTGGVPTPSPHQEFGKPFWTNRSDAERYSDLIGGLTGKPNDVWEWPNPLGVGSPGPPMDGFDTWIVPNPQLPLVGSGLPLPRRR